VKPAAAKKPQETHGQYQARVDSAAPDAPFPLLPPEAGQHGKFDEEFIIHAETGTKAKALRRRAVSGIARMHGNGELTNDQFASSIEIGRVAEMIERAVSVRGASLEARVDNSSSSRDVLIERLYMVRIEATYTQWRTHLPMPRRMVLDMILTTQPLVAIARVHGVPWRLARKRLIASLDRWADIREKVWDRLDERDLAAAHYRIA